LHADKFSTWIVEDTILIGLPTRDRCTNLMFMSPEETYKEVESEEKLAVFFSGRFPDLFPLIGRQKLVTDFYATKPYALRTIKVVMLKFVFLDMNFFVLIFLVPTFQMRQVSTYG
jgi:hypothetical protein